MALKAQQRRSTEERTALWRRRWVQIVGVVVLIVLACLVIETVLGSGGPSQATSSSRGEGFGSLEPGAAGATRPGQP